MDDPEVDLVRKASAAVPVVTYGIDNQDADVVVDSAKMDIWESEVGLLGRGGWRGPTARCFHWCF